MRAKTEVNAKELGAPHLLDGLEAHTSTEFQRSATMTTLRITPNLKISFLSIAFAVGFSIVLGISASSLAEPKQSEEKQPQSASEPVSPPSGEVQERAIRRPGLTPLGDCGCANGQGTCTWKSDGTSAKCYKKATDTCTGKCSMPIGETTGFTSGGMMMK
jgi:hypothetical protein